MRVTLRRYSYSGFWPWRSIKGLRHLHITRPVDFKDSFIGLFNDLEKKALKELTAGAATKFLDKPFQPSSSLFWLLNWCKILCQKENIILAQSEYLLVWTVPFQPEKLKVRIVLAFEHWNDLDVDLVLLRSHIFRLYFGLDNDRTCYNFVLKISSG